MLITLERLETEIIIKSITLKKGIKDFLIGI